jgi:hypothetical protein
MADSGPIIRKIVDPPKMDNKSIHPNLPQPHAQVLMVMPCKCGKSTIGSNCLINDDFYGLDYFDIPPVVISNTINTDITNRFLKKCCDTHDKYDDNIIHKFVASQKKYGDANKMPKACLFVDDCLGDKTTALDALSSRYRHSNIHLLLISTQLFRKVSPVIRSNATNILVGKLQNEKELQKLSDEYSGMYNGDLEFRRLYKEATKKKFSFLHLNLQENPAEAWINFEKKIYPINKTDDEDNEDI